MLSERIGTFASACGDVLKALFAEQPEQGPVTVRGEIATTQQINLTFTVGGDLKGQLIYSMSLATADKISSRILAEHVVTFDARAAMAVADFGSMAAGLAIEKLAEQGIECRVSEPTVVRGKNVRMGPSGVCPAILSSLTTYGVGSVEINLCVSERKTAVA
jgi:chemotaxis protein CheX